MGAHGGIPFQEEEPQRPSAAPAIVISDRPHDEVGDPVVVEIGPRGDAVPEEIDVVEDSGESSRRIADFDVGFHGAVGVEEEDPDRPPITPSIIVAGCADGQIGGTIPVEIAEGGHARSEGVAVVEGSGESACRIADFDVGFHGAIGVEEEDPDRPASAAPVVVPRCPDGEVCDAVAIDVTEGGHARAEGIVEIERDGGRRRGDLHLRLDGAVGVEEEEPDRPTPAVAGERTHGDIRGAVAIEVPEGGHGGAEAVLIGEGAGESPRRRRDLLMSLDGAVGVEEEDPDRPTVHSAIVVEEGADRQIPDTVAVEIADRSHALTEEVGIVERAGESPTRRGDLRFSDHPGPGRTREEEPDHQTRRTPDSRKPSSHDTPLFLRLIRLEGRSTRVGSGLPPFPPGRSPPRIEVPKGGAEVRAVAESEKF